MAAIKKFFQRRKLDIKFKTAGEGRKLTDLQQSSATTQSGQSAAAKLWDNAAAQRELTDERKMAADAAIARLNQKKEKPSSSKPAMSMRAEILAEKREKEEAMAHAKKYSSSSKEVRLESSPVVSGVLFKCSILGNEEAFPKDVMENKIEEFLYSQLGEEPQLTSALMIHTFNKNKDQVKACIEMLSKYLTNIIENPDKENYRRIKSTNKVLNEKVLACKGALEFLQATGFELQRLKVNEVEEDYFVLDIGKQEEAEETTEKFKYLLDVLRVSEPITMELDRDVKVFQPSQRDVSKIEVPEEFYNVSPEELKREQRIREEAVRELGMLRTKEMRERDRLKELRRYRYAIIRVRFPDGFMLQGTFRANDKFSSVRQFVFDSLEVDWIPFNLSTHLGTKIEEDGKTLAELDLAPASLLQFSFDQNVVKEAAQQNQSVPTERFLKADLLEFSLLL